MYSTACGRGDLLDRETEIAESEARGGDEEELRRARFEIAWSQNVSELYRRSLQWTSGRREDADDALGHAALVALEKMPRQLPPEEARRWLLRLVYSKCMDIHRHRRRSACVDWEEGDSPREGAEAVGPDHESVLLADELLAVIQERIHNLPPRLRMIAELHLLREIPYSEIADLLVLTKVNVRKRMQEARSFLREDLQAYLKGDTRIRSPRKANEASGSLAMAEPEPLRISSWTMESLERYVQKHPRGWKKRWELALRLREAGSLEQAVFHFRQAASRQSRRMEIWLDLGQTLLLLGRGDEAREVFEAALCGTRDESSRTRLRALVARCRSTEGVE
jgi:RNA polymerase sigma factor (sigma-70 family)